MEFNKTNHVLLEFGMNINKIQEYPSLKYNYCLHMRSTSCTSYKGNNCFILSKILLRCWMFCFVEDNKIISGSRKYNCETLLYQKVFSTHCRLSEVDRAISYCLPLHYICLDCPPSYFPRRQIFRKTSKLSYFFLHSLKHM